MNELKQYIYCSVDKCLFTFIDCVVLNTARDSAIQYIQELQSYTLVLVLVRWHTHTLYATVQSSVTSSRISLLTSVVDSLHYKSLNWGCQS